MPNHLIDIDIDLNPNVPAVDLFPPNQLHGMNRHDTLDSGCDVAQSEGPQLIQGCEPASTSEHTVDPQVRKRIGVFTAVLMIFNAMVGTSILAIPSNIVRYSRSVGLSLTMWLVGAIVAAAGMQVSIIWGTALPFNGGEKNYLQYLFPNPPHLITSMYAAYAVLVAHGATNAVVFAEYTLAALYPATLDPQMHEQRKGYLSLATALSVFSLTIPLLLHGFWPSAGLRLQNLLGIFKIGVLGVVAGTGVYAFAGNLQEGVENPHNFESWDRIWEGTRRDAAAVCSSLYTVVWAYWGYSTANYALAEMHNPEWTLRIAGPIALIFVILFYMLCNVAYFSAVTKEEIAGSGRKVAALLLRNVWGVSAGRIVSVCIALTSLGNLLATSFGYGRVNQALAQDGVLPFPKALSSNWPAQAPLGGLTVHWMVCMVVVLVIPSGDAYTFLYNLGSYPLAVVNILVAFGLVYLSLRQRSSNMDSGTPKLLSSTPNSEDIPLLTQDIAISVPASPISFPASPSLLIPATLYGIANVFLIIVPLMKPPPGAEPYVHLPYWIHAAGGTAILLIGGAWWYFRLR